MTGVAGSLCRAGGHRTGRDGGVGAGSGAGLARAMGQPSSSSLKLLI